MEQNQGWTKGIQAQKSIRKMAKGTVGHSLKMGCQAAPNQAQLLLMISGFQEFNYPLHKNNSYLKAKEAKDDLHGSL